VPKTTLQDGGFITYDDRFWAIIGMAPTIEVISENAAYPFAHEAGVYTPSTGNIFITSSLLSTAGKKKIQISKIVRNETGTYSCEEIEPGISLANGGVNYKDGVLFCEQGTLTEPGGLVYMEAAPPYRTEVVVSNYHGRWFNSINDVVVHSDGSIWFTDPSYGFEQDIRLRPQLPNQIYRYDPADGDIRAVADGMGKPNGLCFSPDEKTLYVTDTDGLNGKGIYEPSRAASM
jgi:gluconolactonase